MKYCLYFLLSNIYPSDLPALQFTSISIVALYSISYVALFSIREAQNVHICLL